ncbi:glutamate racemase [Mycobacterium bourgelatii]|uniref:Glutamate racemase n=2 Tax=Mycobacterium bourgelatii TaxID=1273442 RepID=A0A7I9YS46_MYCBU|nr:aspartate/glutamate racemase family protein [Mycobacterium bourgelatii]GFG91488.1 glutamate racemase [Mycobacterium bourgelatii]
MHANSCLGIVDWGIGGLGLVKNLDRLAPGLPILYWSDAGATPYGRMTADELTDRLMTVVSALTERGATEVVLACNAASTVVERLGAAPIPVEGIITHGLASVSEDLASIGVVGGHRTIDAGHYRRGLARPGRRVLSRVAQPLSAHIEAGRTGSPRFFADLAAILAPLHDVEALVLACTHYPAASAWFAAALPSAILIDPAERMAAAIAERHPEARATGRQRLAERKFFTTGDVEAMRRGAFHAWGTVLPAHADQVLRERRVGRPRLTA